MLPLEMFGEVNPYEAPSPCRASAPEVARFAEASACPVCGIHVKRLPLLMPVFSCSNCNRRLVISSTWKTKAISTASIGVLAIGYIVADLLSIDRIGYLFAALLVFLICSTVGLYCFGQPRLKGWFGYATTATVFRERRCFAAEQQGGE